MNIRKMLITGMFGLSSMLPAKAQTAVEVVNHTPLTETVAKDTVKTTNKIVKDISLRTFQNLDGSNVTGLGIFGLEKNYKKTTAYISPLFGFEAVNKKPVAGAFGYIDWRYKKNPKNLIWSQEIYGEAINGSVFDSKLTYTPLKLTIARLFGNTGLSIDPRIAEHMNKDGFNPPKLEVLITLFGQLKLSKKKPNKNNMSWYLLFQTYDTTHLGEKGSNAAIGINGGLIYKLPEIIKKKKAI